MGDAESKPSPGDGGDDQHDPRRAEKLFEAFQSQQVDARAAFEQAYADTPGAFQGISDIVNEIESSGTHAHPGNAQTGVPRATTNTRIERRSRALARKAESDADSWLERQLSKAKSEPARRRPAQPAQPLQKAPPPPKEPDQRQPRHEERTRIEPAMAQKAVSPKDEVGSKAPASPIAADEAAEDFDVSPFPPSRAFGDALSSMRVPVQLPIPIDDALPAPQGNTEPAKAAREEAKTPAGVPLPEFYRLLGVDMDATFEEVRKGYRKQALLWHPDKNRQRLAEATARFQRINEAFDTLFDPKKRAEYDAGKVKLPGRAKKLQGHGWSKVSDEDEATLTPYGAKLKKQSWFGYIYFGGRIDDVDPIRDPDRDPRTPTERVKVFWRYIGEKAYEAREEFDPKFWLQDFIEEVWKDTPSRWPGAQALQGMSEASRQEWKERRMVFNRRRQKVLIHVDLHEEYLALPDREKKEKDRLRQIWPDSIKD